MHGGSGTLLDVFYQQELVAVASVHAAVDRIVIAHHVTMATKTTAIRLAA